LDSGLEILWLGIIQKIRTITIQPRKRTGYGHLKNFIGVIFIGKFTVPLKSGRYLITVRATFFSLSSVLFVREFQAVLRIRDVYPGSRIRLFTIPDPGSELSPSRIPDPNCLHPGSRIPDPGSSSKNLSILTPKKAKKWFLSYKKI
jgi:hypothetical protein